MVELESATLERGKGILGDRYHSGTGKFSGVEGWGANITLIEAEAIEAVNSGYQTDLVGGDLRRNIVTRGLRLNDLVGKIFRIGPDVVCRGARTFPPCTHLARLLKSNLVLKQFAYCGGIGADIVSGGTIEKSHTIIVGVDDEIEQGI